MIFPSAAFDAAAMLEAIQAGKAHSRDRRAYHVHRANAASGLRRVRRELAARAMIGGAPCPVELLRRMNAEMHCEEVSVIYGQTEASPVITMHASGDTLEQRSSTVGRRWRTRR